MLSNAYFLAKFRFDTAENEPAKNLQIFRKNAFLKNAFSKNAFSKNAFFGNRIFRPFGGPWLPGTTDDASFRTPALRYNEARGAAFFGMSERKIKCS